jgi:hypothetical protein
MLTHAASLRSTKALAILRASSCDPAVVKMIRAFVMNSPVRVYQSGAVMGRSVSAGFKIIDGGLKPFAAELQLTGVLL